MTTVTVINEKEVHINALFVQPTTYCAKNCSGCYVKGHENISGANSLPADTLGLLIRQNFLTRNSFVGSDSPWPAFSFNQITMALDTLPRDNKHHERVMRDHFKSYCAGLYTNHDKNTEYHLTVNQIGDLIEYFCSSGEEKEKGIYSLEDRLEFCRTNFDSVNKRVFAGFLGLDMLSISMLTSRDIEDIKALKNVYQQTINWNYQPWGPVEKQLKNIKEVLPYVDSMYYIINKPDLGHKLRETTVEGYFELLDRMQKELPRELWNKITVDGCVTDAKKYVKTGFGCSSNVSRFQIWPNGAVSGCPYKHKATTGPLDKGDNLTLPELALFQGLLKNIREAAQTYEFNSCKIPDSLHPNHPRIVHKQNPFLVILED